jgi:hypothetical protein
MNPKYIAAGIIAIGVIVGFNIFLAQRDSKLYDAYGYTTQQK